MMRELSKILLGVVILTSSAALAQPSYITDGLMTWQRYDPGSTWQEWTFDTDANPAAPESSYNPYGNPTASFTGYDGSADFGWRDIYENRGGVWGGDTLDAEFYIPNNPNQLNPYKIIWFEMEYQAVEVYDPPMVQVAQGFDVEQIYYNPNYYGTDTWMTMVVGWKVYPNPTEEIITVGLWGTGGFINSVSIDTICVVPAPAAIPLVGLGLLVVGHFKRKNVL